MFDLEGVPSFGEGDAYIYLWGTRVVGDEYRPVFAGLDQNGDRFGWERFLERVESIFETHGPHARFVHWSSYEKVQIAKYLAEYGDRGGTGERLLTSLFDLYAEIRRTVVLPLPSYSLKVVEEYVGFERTQTEIGGDWSITVWDEILSTRDPQQRQQLIDTLATYNDEDLLGMLAVFDWLSAHAR